MAWFALINLLILLGPLALIPLGQEVLVSAVGVPGAHGRFCSDLITNLLGQSGTVTVR